jgi:hypothetical protein
MTSNQRFAGLGLLALALVAAPGCRLRLAGLLPFQVIEGSGQIVEEAREIEPFKAIEAHNAFLVRYEPAAETTLRIKADDNLIPLVLTHVDDAGRLVLRVKEQTNIHSERPIEIILTSPGVSELEAHGACRVEAVLAGQPEVAIDLSGASNATIRGIESAKLSVEASGASQARLEGQATAAVIEASGASSVVAEACPVDTAAVDISGASRARLLVRSSLSGGASGASTVVLVAKPGEVNVETSGASRVAYDQKAVDPSANGASGAAAVR